jgi:hypothetical protein
VAGDVAIQHVSGFIEEKELNMRKYNIVVVGLICVALAACSDSGSSTNENEVITTVILKFAPATGATVTATFNDPDGDGGGAPTIDPVNLAAGNYTLTAQFQNRLANPQVEITDEIREEKNFHLLLFTGSAVVGPATTNTTGPLEQSYSDADDNTFPVGLTNAIVAHAGTGLLTVTLRHMPPEEPPVKAANTVALVKTGGVDSIGGSTDAQVNFNVTVQ